MKRLLAGVVLGWLIFATPVVAVLKDAAFASVTAQSVVATNYIRITQSGSISGPLLLDWATGESAIFGGDHDPRLIGEAAPIGSLYLSPTGVFAKTGPNPSDWSCIAGCAP